MSRKGRLRLIATEAILAAALLGIGALTRGASINWPTVLVRFGFFLLGTLPLVSLIYALRRKYKRPVWRLMAACAVAFASMPFEAIFVSTGAGPFRGFFVGLLVTCILAVPVMWAIWSEYPKTGGA